VSREGFGDAASLGSIAAGPLQLTCGLGKNDEPNQIRDYSKILITVRPSTKGYVGP